MTNPTIKIVLVDDHAVVRTGYRLLLEDESDIEVIAELSSGEEANQQIPGLEADVVVMDLSMPGMGGIEALKRLRAKLPKLKMLVFSMHDNQAFLEHALNAGANGYITKNSAPNILVEAVHVIAEGKQYIDPDLKDKLNDSTGRNNGGLLGRLSKRELQVFCKFAEGMSSTEIAEELSLSIKTVANYQTSIKEKLEINTSSELVKLAISLGVIQM